MTFLYPPGDAPITWHPGDFLLTHSKCWEGAAIRFGQRIRFPKPSCYFNHAALVVSTDGGIVEALSGGVTATNASKYKPGEYVIVDPGISDLARLDAVRFARSMVGTPYGWWTVGNIAITLLTGARFRFDRPGTVICSGLVAAAMDVDEWRPDPSHVLPAELALRWGVLPPT